MTHELGFAREVGHRIMFMDGGVVVEEGPSGVILAHPTNPRTQQFIRAVL